METPLHKNNKENTVNGILVKKKKIERKYLQYKKVKNYCANSS
jgi:hypothetical protein